jgi:2-haloacid dehalogenase
MLQLAFVGGLSGEYVDFSAAQHAALLMLGEKVGRTVDPVEATDMVERMSSLPPYPEVAEALRRLHGSGVRTVALTNSVAAVAEAQLSHAGLRDAFDDVISADSVRRLKPAPEPYLAVARAFAVDITDVRLVAAHSWDVSGAMAAGCSAAFVTRPGQVLSPIGRQPDIVGADIADAVDQILTREAT